MLIIKNMKKVSHKPTINFIHKKKSQFTVKTQYMPILIIICVMFSSKLYLHFFRM